MGSIRLKTKIPGPLSTDLQRRRLEAMPRGFNQLSPVFVARSDGALLEDVDGNVLIDLAGGIGCLNSGHRSEAVISAIRAQAELFLHTCAHVTLYDSYIELAEILNRITPGNFPKKTFFVNSGAEAVENAVKIVRASTRRPAIVCFQDAFHGRTAMGMALTSKPHPYKAGFEPLPGHIYRIPYAYCYRCSYGKSYPQCEIYCGTDAILETFQRVVPAEEVGAVIVEPVQGEGGFIVPPPGFLPAIKAICEKYGILLVADEVQTGFARTGRMFACEHFGIEPDILITAKSLGGGLPLGAITGRAELMDAPGIGALGTTFGGNPLSCVAALASLKVIETQDLCRRAEALGLEFERRALAWQKRWPMVGNIRRLGAMCAVELIRPAPERAPATAETKEVLNFCHSHGVVVISAGSFGNVIRLLMPLVITDAQLNEALDVLEEGVSSVAGVEETVGKSRT
jgi:4-aminobutyrate aminotransferase / (S)-3-amino-2-methylpropionate transaminase / 5-aminovalerate transaminase